MTLGTDETPSATSNPSPSNSFELDPDEITPSINEKKRLKSRSVSFAPTVDEIEIPSRTSPSYEYRRQDYLDALVDSYKIQTAVHLSFPNMEEKKYVPKTNRTRLTPHWREHRLRHLMNKLEELALWDREEEMKQSQAQFLREQKLEQIADRQRNHDLCLHLMRQRHESEMESAVLLDRSTSQINDELRKSSIAQAKRLQHSLSLSSIPSAVEKRKSKEKQLNSVELFQTPLGRYRQFEMTMKNKLEKIEEQSPSSRDWKLMSRSIYPSIPNHVVPLFSETYVSLLNLPDAYLANKSPQYRQAPHASSPDYETRRRAYSNRDVRVPLKDHLETDEEEMEEPRSASRNDSTITGKRSLPNHSRIHERSLTDDFNTLTKSSFDTTKRMIPNLSQLPIEKSFRNSSFVPHSFPAERHEEKWKNSPFTPMKYSNEILA